MIERVEAERIAAVWARRESVRRGFECTPMLSEFDIGYVVWSKLPPTVVPQPDDGGTTVIDKETGKLSTWPSLPSHVVESMYRQRRHEVVPAVLTTDPQVELRRNTTRRPTPAMAAHVTFPTRVVIARGAKGDQEINHHPLVVEYLLSQPAGTLVRGVDRHAEMIVVSDVLHEEDRRRQESNAAPLTIDDVRYLMNSADIEVFQVREPGDPFGGRATDPCESCIGALVHFNLLPWSKLAFTEPRDPATESVVTPAVPAGRFPDDIARVLAAGAWAPRDTDQYLADGIIEQVTGTPGQEHRHTEFPVARQAITDFPGVLAMRRGPGSSVYVRAFELSPANAMHNADVLADFGRLLGTRMFPLGSEGPGQSFLVIDESGRVFALDQAGEWFIGDTLDAAIVTLMTGGPVARIHDDGTW